MASRVDIARANEPRIHAAERLARIRALASRVLAGDGARNGEAKALARAILAALES